MRSDDRIGRTNHDSGYINQYDIRKLSKGIIVAHSNHISDIKNSEEKFLYIAPQIGIREGIRFKGEETLILEDVLNGKTYEKILFYAYSDIDKHGADTVLDEETYQDWYVISNLSTVTVRIPVPLGAIVPKGIKGIISGGRCLSADCYVSSAIRMNRDMYRLGKLNLAAAMCIQSGKDILEIDYDELNNV